MHFLTARRRLSAFLVTAVLLAASGFGVAKEGGGVLTPWPESRTGNSAGSDTKTPLMIAAQSGDAGLVAHMIDDGVDVNATNANGGTALMFAAIGGDPTVTAILLRAGARTDRKAMLGWTALALAAVKGHTAVAESLLAAGADPDVRDAYGWTPLMRAVDTKHPEVARLLVESAHADLSLRQEDGATVLHIAAASGDAAMVAYLLSMGADCDAEDARGNTASAIARQTGHTDIAALLDAEARKEIVDEPG